MPIVVPLAVAAAVGTGVATTIGTAIAGSAIGSTVATAIGAGLVGAGASVATGKKVKDSLKFGLKIGLTSAIGGTLGKALSGAGSGISGIADVADEVYQGASAVAPAVAAPAVAAPAAVVPSAFDTAINQALEGGGSLLGNFGPIGTAGFGEALPSAAALNARLVAAGFAPGTAANLAGQTAAGIGATNLFGGATAFSPLIQSPGLSASDVFRGARLVGNLLAPQQQPEIPQQEQTNIPQGEIDYSGLLGLLSQRAKATGLLGTQFQPQPLNLTSLLG